MSDRPRGRGLGAYEHRRPELPLPSDNTPFVPHGLHSLEEVGTDPHMRDIVEDDCEITVSSQTKQQPPEGLGTDLRRPVRPLGPSNRPSRVSCSLYESCEESGWVKVQVRGWSSVVGVWSKLAQFNEVVGSSSWYYSFACSCRGRGRGEGWSNDEREKRGGGGENRRAFHWR